MENMKPFALALYVTGGPEPFLQRLDKLLGQINHNKLEFSDAGFQGFNVSCVLLFLQELFSGFRSEKGVS
jgi:hypothetical protein